MKSFFTTSFGYMDHTIKVAKEFPNVKFEHITGYKRLQMSLLVTFDTTKAVMSRVLLQVLCPNQTKLVI